MKKISIDELRNDIIGNDSLYKTPFGEMNLFYADYTASGRALGAIENNIMNILKSYANTHTTDDFSGKFMTSLLYNAEEKIKQMINAGSDYKLISTGSGCTGALQKLQEILGIYIPPHTKDRIFSSLKGLNCKNCSVLEKINIDRPVVFIGPYEHHTNELMWREAFAEIVVIELDRDGGIDRIMLEKELKKEKYKDRVKYCSFSAGSNITGMLTDTASLAEIAHANGAQIFFDFAAVAPYVEIDVTGKGQGYFDAVFFSPHKFLGGPGTAGILVFHKKLYRADLPPTTAGGGTVDYVGFRHHDYSADIETREKAGTPPIIQTIKAAMVMELKNSIGLHTIEEIENKNKEKFFSRFSTIDEMVIIGNTDPLKRIPIISFNIKHMDKYLHPRFVTRLLSDLFGIQSRAGCSCAGPYGHRLLGIDEEKSLKYRNMIINENLSGIKPGWVRINLHYVFSEEDLEYVFNALEFICIHGAKFLNLYAFDPITAEWRKLGHNEEETVFSIDNIYDLKSLPLNEISAHRADNLKRAIDIASDLKYPDASDFITREGLFSDLSYFYYCHEL